MRLSHDLVLVINGTIVFFVVLAALRFLASRRQSQFRDDIWDDKGGKSGAQAATSEQIGRTVDYIALEVPADEKTEKIEKPKPPPKEQAPESPYRPPNFRGKSHEILGIAADADRETVLAAYKHWIKRYHPDRVQHLGPGYVKQANARTEQLNDAKAALLKRFS